uniref:Uncharacterized protein n=1 Tax=Anguilla anguilla TaxID=7936 RepID=A0A0E9THR4_ANGAN
MLIIKEKRQIKPNVISKKVTSVHSV